MISIALSPLSFYFCLVLVTNVKCSDKNLPMGNIITKYGYPYENHSVTSEDGYVLTMGRIPEPKNNVTCKIKKGPIVLQHGVFQAADAFVLAGPNDSLGFYLSNACYDVWLPSARGTIYSLGHTSMTHSQNEYWNFSYDEEGRYDVKSVIDYILNVSNATKVSYVGFSKGTTILMVFLHYHPTYSDFIKNAHFMAPVAYWSQLGALLPPKTAMTLTQYGGSLLNFPVPLPFSPYLLPEIGKEICRDKAHFCPAEELAAFNEHLTKAIVPTVIVHYSTFSMRTACLFAQTGITGEFKPYDFGKEENSNKYGTVGPPLYNLSNVLIPVHLYYGREDNVTILEDVKALEKQLPDVRLMYEVPIPAMTHNMFLFSSDQVFYVYDIMLKYLDYQ